MAWLAAEAERQPVLVAWEDLHWADPTTLEALGLVVEQAPTVPMLHVLTYRPEFSPRWPPCSHITPLALNRLERPQVEALIALRAGSKTLPAEVVQDIIAKTDGVPLYVEELTKMLLASPLLREEADQYVLTGPLRTVAIPDTLQDALMARLDQLNRAKEVAQLGAVLGRVFAYALLQAIASQAGIYTVGGYGNEAARPILVHLADVSAHLGHAEDGLRALAEAHTLVEQHEERYWEAEVARLRGVLLLRQPGMRQAEAEAWLQRALDLARRQEAKSLELRAAMSLARLWQLQGKQAEAHALLAPIYTWFTQGFDRADLQEAKALLDALGG